MIHIYLCEDSQSSLNTYAGLISDLAAKHHIEISLHSFSSGEALLFHLSECTYKADIIYLDILLDATNGIETAQKLRMLGCQAEIIFLTTRGFRIRSLRYCPSPLSAQGIHPAG